LKPLWVTPLAISSVAAEQNGKKQGKGIVNRRDGFVSVAGESDLDSVIKGFVCTEAICAN
jgi:hypothetical protein